MITIMEIDLKWFHFDQNNSGGYFDIDDNVCETVFIQAPTAKMAMDKMEYLTENQSGSCGCCGDRWCIDVSDDEGTDIPMRYGKSLEEDTIGCISRDYRMHYFNGNVVKG